MSGSDNNAPPPPTQEVLTPSHPGARDRATSSLNTPTRAMQTPRGTRNSRAAGGRGGLDDMVTHKKLSRRRLAIYDRVYGQILFPPVIRLFIDSPEVQRLRDLKQLGNGHYVYPSATHTRFEHSLGVSHLAMTFLKQILTNHAEEPGLGERVLPARSPDGSPDMQKEIWCVGIAGLCHDLGHGPLSHMFEKYVNSVREQEGKPAWSHEQASISMLRSIWHAKRKELEEAGLGDKDLAFVELMINGLRPGAPWPEKAVGRSADMRFMTDIIANKRSGLDVDKIDYLQRDSLSCFGTPALVSLDRLFQGACVMRDENDETQVCYQSKLEGSVEEIFQARTRLHRIVYQHRVTCVMDQMATDAFLHADRFFKISFEGRQYRLSECVDVPGAYVQTGDWIINSILRSHEDGLAAARQILDRTQNRRIYTTIGTNVGVSSDAMFSQKAFIRRVADEDLRQRLMSWNDAHPGWPVLVQIQTKITKAAGDMKALLDPMDAIRFYNPRHGEEATPYLRQDQQLSGRAASFSQPASPEQTFIVICRMPLTASDLNALSNTFNEVAAEQGAFGVTDRSISPGAHRTRSCGRLSLHPSPNTYELRAQSDRHVDTASAMAPSTAGSTQTNVHKREREEPGVAHRGGKGEERADRFPRMNEGGPLPLDSWPPTHLSFELSGTRGTSGDQDLMIPPQVFLQSQQTQQQQRQSSQSQKRHDKPPASATSPFHVEADGEEGQTDAVVDDVELSMHPLSQLDNSRSNADEPEIQIGFSNVSHGSPSHAGHSGDDEKSHLEPPSEAMSQGSASRQRKYVTIDESTEKKH